jgi:hypothetical protein
VASEERLEKERGKIREIKKQSDMNKIASP